MAISDTRLARRIHYWDVDVFLRLNRQMFRSRLPAVARHVSHLADGWLYLFAPLAALSVSITLAKLVLIQLAIAFLSREFAISP